MINRPVSYRDLLAQRGGLSTATWRYQRRETATNAEVRARLEAHAAARSRFGYRRLHILLEREGFVVNHKRVHRIYRAAGLQVRRRRRKRLTRADRVPLPIMSQRLERWSMDFTADTLGDGRTFRTLNIVDDFTRECVAIEVDRSLPGLRVTRVLDRRQGDGRLAANDRRRQRTRVCRPHAGCVGRMRTACRYASFARGSRSKTRTWKASTGNFVMSV
jgi:transposase InsO family protein